VRSSEQRRRAAYPVIEEAIGAVIALAILWAVIEYLEGSPMTSDGDGLLFLEGVLVLLVFIAIGQEVLARYRRTPGTGDLSVKRGDQSMNVLYIMYGTATVMCALAVDVSEAFEGCKVWFIILNYGALTYLFLNSWFRNSVLFPLYTRMRWD